jgi:hypothetical protein
LALSDKSIICEEYKGFPVSAKCFSEASSNPSTKVIILHNDQYVKSQLSASFRKECNAPAIPPAIAAFQIRIKVLQR